MGHSQQEKQRTHDRIVAVASRRLREKGIEGIGVADLMKEAGLTVGGFYKHFGSRDDMVVEAMELAFDTWETKVRSQGKSLSAVRIEEYVGDYLSPSHRDDVAGGCAFAALTADLARSSEKCRTAATSRLQSNIERMIARLSVANMGEAANVEADNAGARRLAIVLSCLMTGAVGLSRISNDEAFSDEILHVVEAFVTGQVADKPRSTR